MRRRLEISLAKPTVQVENDRVIVTEWRFPPGGHTGWHKHMHDYVVVPITTGEPQRAVMIRPGSRADITAMP